MVKPQILATGGTTVPTHRFSEFQANGLVKIISEGVITFNYPLKKGYVKDL